jgi:hypothetical protein
LFSVTIIDRLFVSFAPHLGTCFRLQHYVLINSFHAENHDLNLVNTKCHNTYRIGMSFRPFLVKETDKLIRSEVTMRITFLILLSVLLVFSGNKTSRLD